MRGERERKDSKEKWGERRESKKKWGERREEGEGRERSIEL